MCVCAATLNMWSAEPLVPVYGAAWSVRESGTDTSIACLLRDVSVEGCRERVHV